MRKYLDRKAKMLVNELGNCPVLLTSRQGTITKQGFLLLVLERNRAAQSFASLLKTAHRAAKLVNDSELAAVLYKNWEDETGHDRNGKINKELSHEVWRQWFLRALQIDPATQTKPLPTTKSYNNTINRLIKQRTNYMVLAGALLFLELCIPRELESIQIARDKLFPGQFVHGVKDTPAKQEEKRRARLYVDFHITFDRWVHYPELLTALNGHRKGLLARKLVYQGMLVAKLARQQLWNGLGNELGL